MKQQFLDLNGLTELVTYLKKSITEQKEILPYASNKLFPSTGNVNTIYIDTATNSIYRWDSSNKKYEILAKAVKSVSISESTENGKITLTVDGNKTTVPIHGLGSAAYTNSSAYSPAGHTHTKAQVGLGNVDNTADANKSVKHAITADSATTAGTATNVSAGEGTADAARHVWFSDSATETKRAYSDKFKYNPVTNNLTVNVTGNAATASSVAWGNVTGKPSTLPASDVYAWAKASTKPSYTKAEVGLGSVDNTADSAKSVKYATSAGSANAVAWANVSGKPSITGKQTRTLTASGPSGWKDAATDQGFVPDMAFMAYWNGAYSGSSSNLAYCNRGAFGTIVTKNAGDYATASHTHHYAGSSSAGGAATSANKLATARTVSGGTDVTLSFNYDGSGNSSANIGFYSSSASVGNTNNYPFHRFAKLDTITGSYVDKSTTFFISQDYSGGGFGIVRITLRTNDSKTVSSVEVKWLVRSGLNADSVQVGLYNVYGKTYADAFFKTGGSYAGTYFRAIASGARGGASRTWVMVSSSETNGTTTSDPKTSAECYASIASAGTKLHNQAYSATISGSDTGTASYANSAGSVAWANVSGRPSSMPASDVSAWAKASSKPSYSWGEITGKPSTFTPASHTHNYAGSSSAGGNANAAVKLATARKIGNASFDGTANITLSQMGLNIPVEITKADYLAKKKAGTLNANTYYNVIDEYDSANVINDSSVTANSAFSSTKSEKTYAKKSAIINTTLTASKWTGSSAPYSYVLSVSGVTSSNIVEIDYASNASSAAIEAYQNAMLADGGQTTNQITIKATEKPTVDIPITIVIRNDL